MWSGISWWLQFAFPWPSVNGSSLHIPVGHLYVFFGEVFIWVILKSSYLFTYFSLFSCMSSLNSLDIHPLLDTWCADMSPSPWGAHRGHSPRSEAGECAEQLRTGAQVRTVVRWVVAAAQVMARCRGRALSGMMQQRLILSLGGGRWQQHRLQAALSAGVGTSEDPGVLSHENCRCPWQ